MRPAPLCTSARRLSDSPTTRTSRRPRLGSSPRRWWSRPTTPRTADDRHAGRVGRAGEPMVTLAAGREPPAEHEATRPAVIKMTRRGACCMMQPVRPRLHIVGGTKAAGDAGEADEALGVARKGVSRRTDLAHHPSKPRCVGSHRSTAELRANSSRARCADRPHDSASAVSIISRLEVPPLGLRRATGAAPPRPCIWCARRVCRQTRSGLDLPTASASFERVRDHLRRPLPGGRDLLMETAGNTVNAIDPLIAGCGGRVWPCHRSSFRSDGLMCPGVSDDECCHADRDE